MLMSNFLRDRKSTREYKDKDVSKETLEKIMEYGEDIEKEIGDKSFKFLLLKNGDKVYELLKGKGGYAGVMIKSPHYIGLEILNDSRDAIIKGSYAMEKLITKVTEYGLGTCWISIESVDEETKKELYDNLEGNIDYILAIGNPVPKNPFIQEPDSCRLSIEDIVFKGEIGKNIAADELESRGLSDLFYYTRFAPSSYNNQPWRFILKDNKIVLILMKDEDKFSFIDAGIIMYYFENMASAIGITGKWQLLNDKDVEVNGITYNYIGEFNI
ncbi:nitroreductase [Anaerosalibacter bizertensis]|uniref:Nitroreductase n=2 Tax=Anaerosalibacter bizertensis TaxID=932217 RepID=A0A844FE09_9FIRM|nr:nitroreductase family protein [Anaerosalibacter bizertensis]MCB5559510.1 nitroreductase family protein [Anaerosalibacter bizertensis]MSS42224.1 nitroreductase [Anaerosalibacter bizertensis]